MPRSETARVSAITAELRTRLDSGLLLPGEPFISARQLAQQREISYQTAHRILAGLAGEGRIQRRVGAPSVVAGEYPSYTRVALCFSGRARRAGSFGGCLRDRMRTALEDADLPFEICYDLRPETVPVQVYPVFWEVEVSPGFLVASRRHALFLNDRPSMGRASRLVDSITLDDFGGGYAAAELLADVYGCRQLAVLGGPEWDRRSRERIRGFRARAENVAEVHAGHWGETLSQNVLNALFRFSPDGVFCANDRLAARLKQAYAQTRQKMPVLIGFDNAPISAEERLTTIAIPWDVLVTEAVAIIRRRIDGYCDPGRHRVLTCEEVIRN